MIWKNPFPLPLQLKNTYIFRTYERLSYSWLRVDFRIFPLDPPILTYVAGLPGITTTWLYEASDEQAEPIHHHPQN